MAAWPAAAPTAMGASMPELASCTWDHAGLQAGDMQEQTEHGCRVAASIAWGCSLDCMGLQRGRGGAAHDVVSVLAVGALAVVVAVVVRVVVARPLHVHHVVHTDDQLVRCEVVLGGR
eukprot:scaffold96085_cov94-Phaeocystis_antarctica.AAC.1